VCGYITNKKLLQPVGVFFCGTGLNFWLLASYSERQNDALGCCHLILWGCWAYLLIIYDKKFFILLEYFIRIFRSFIFFACSCILYIFCFLWRPFLFTFSKCSCGKVQGVRLQVLDRRGNENTLPGRSHPYYLMLHKEK
jgi:hypothetical protein